MSRCIPPPAPSSVSNDNGLEERVERLKARLHTSVPANETSPHLTEQYAEWSDYGNREMWVDLYTRLKKSERSGRTGASRRKRRATR